MSPTTVYPAREGQKFAGETTFVIVTCATCRMAYGIPEGLYNSALKWRGDRADGRGWKLCCPVGHTWWFAGETEEDRLRRIAERARDEQARLRSQLDQSEASRIAQKAAAKRARNERDRLKTRARHGVCPCCNRTFKQLARHMESQHPDYGPGDA